MSTYNELQKFQDAVRNLTITIRAVNALWRDEKYAELSQSVIDVAKLSRRVMEAGERCEQSAEKFERIANETV